MLETLLSWDFLNSVLRMTTPLLFAAMAAIISNKADVLCIAFEGIMLFGAFGASLGNAWFHCVGGGMIVGLILGVFMAAVFGYFVIYLDTKPMLIGLALNMLGSGGTVFLLYLVAGTKSSSSMMESHIFPDIDIPIIKNIPVLGQVLSGHNFLTYLSFLSVLIVWLILFKTPLGLRIRSVGENPTASEAVGINVKKTQFIALIISGILAALGGIYMTTGYLPYFTRDMVAGRGFMGIAAQNLGAGNPVLTMLSTIFFGAAIAVGNIAQQFAIPSQFAAMLPYIATLFGLVLMNLRKVVKSEV